MPSGIDDELSMRANREVFTLDLSVDVFGKISEKSIFVALSGGYKAIHPEGEIVAARARRVMRYLNLLSTSSANSIEDMVAAEGVPFWYQLYASPIITQGEAASTQGEAASTQGEAASTPVLTITVYRLADPNRETFLRLRPSDSRFAYYNL